MNERHSYNPIFGTAFSIALKRHWQNKPDIIAKFRGAIQKSQCQPTPITERWIAYGETGPIVRVIWLPRQKVLLDIFFIKILNIYANAIVFWQEVIKRT